MNPVAESMRITNPEYVLLFKILSSYYDQKMLTFVLILNLIYSSNFPFGCIL